MLFPNAKTIGCWVFCPVHECMNLSHCVMAVGQNRDRCVQASFADLHQTKLGNQNLKWKKRNIAKSNYCVQIITVNVKTWGVKFLVQGSVWVCPFSLGGGKKKSYHRFTIMIIFSMLMIWFAFIYSIHLFNVGRKKENACMHNFKMYMHSASRKNIQINIKK